VPPLHLSLSLVLAQLHALLPIGLLLLNILLVNKLEEKVYSTRLWSITNVLIPFLIPELGKSSEIAHPHLPAQLHQPSLLQPHMLLDLVSPTVATCSALIKLLIASLPSLMPLGIWLVHAPTHLLAKLHQFGIAPQLTMTFLILSHGVVISGSINGGRILNLDLKI